MQNNCNIISSCTSTQCQCLCFTLILHTRCNYFSSKYKKLETRNIDSTLHNKWSNNEWNSKGNNWEKFEILSRIQNFPKSMNVTETCANKTLSKGRPLHRKKMPILQQMPGINPKKSIFTKTEFMACLPELFYWFFLMTIDFFGIFMVQMTDLSMQVKFMIMNTSKV